MLSTGTLLENKVKLVKNDDAEEIKFITPTGPAKAVVLFTVNLNVKKVSLQSKQ